MKWSGWVCVVALFVGCATRGRPPETSPGPSVARYLPLKVGNSWTYERTFLGETGEEKVEIVRTEGDFYVDSRGNALKVDAFGIRDPKRYLLRGPLESGNAWTVVVSASSTERYRILDVNFTCEVPAGRFTDCVRVEAKTRIDQAKSLVNEITFAPGVGMVRFDFFLEKDQDRVPQGQMVLTGYSIH